MKRSTQHVGHLQSHHIISLKFRPFVLEKMECDVLFGELDISLQGTVESSRENAMQCDVSFGELEKSM